MCLKELTAYANPDGGRPIFGWAGLKQGLPELKLPCGKCSECIHDYYSFWATRGYYELLRWPSSYFITFTYKEMPEGHSLSKKEFQKFIKLLKKKFGSSKENPIRQIYCGEYGEKNFRPHYHAIFFNLNLTDLEETRVSDSGFTCYTSKTISDLWKKGMIEISEATPATIAYLFKYILKKKSRKEKKVPLTITDHEGITWTVEHEFIEASRNPGIGAHMRDSDSILKGFLSVDGIPRALPKYFLEYLKNAQPAFYEQIKDQRFDHAQRQPVVSRDEKERRDAHYKMLQKTRKRD